MKTPMPTPEMMMLLMQRMDAMEAEFRKQASAYIDEINRLQEIIAQMRSRTFGRSTESSTSMERFSLLDYCQGEANVGKTDDSSEEDASEKAVEVESYTRRRKRREIPKSIPRRDVYEDLPEELKHCPNCGGDMSFIRYEVSERLVYKPEELYVSRTHTPVFSCHHCKDKGLNTIVTAPARPQLIRGGYADTSLVAQFICAKYVDGMPVYREVKAIKRCGMPMEAKEVYLWIITAYERCITMYRLLYEELRKGNSMHMDETPFQVLKEVGKEDSQASYMWCATGGGNYKVRLFRYARTRKGTEADDILGSFRGFLQTDAYPGYAHLKNREGLILVSCLAHIRRKFADILKASAGAKASKSTSAIIIDLIRKVYRTENRLRKKYSLDLEEDRTLFLQERKEAVMPVLEKIKAVLDETNAPPKSSLGKAISYARDNWTTLLNYLDCPDLTPDNNEAENAIRPYVVGRKAWLFSGCPAGAEASAFFYSLVETAKANDVEPDGYLRMLLEKVLYAKTEEDYRALMPWNFAPKK